MGNYVMTVSWNSSENDDKIIEGLEKLREKHWFIEPTFDHIKFIENKNQFGIGLSYYHYLFYNDIAKKEALDLFKRETLKPLICYNVDGIEYTIIDLNETDLNEKLIQDPDFV